MIKKILAGVSGSLLMVLGVPMVALAVSSQVIVTPTNTQGWTTADTRPGGTVSYSTDRSAPGNPHNGALRLTTDLSTTAKAQYMHEANVALANVTELSYSTKQDSAVFPGGDASYQLPVCLGGLTASTVANPSGCIGFTTFVYEPYQNGVVLPGVWQSWDVDSGQFWSSRPYTNGGTCTVVAGGGGAPFYNLATLKTMCPSAVVVGFGVNIGSNNPGYNVQTDLVNFNGTTYNFEPYREATNKDDCKKDGYIGLTDADGNAFKNQGQCVSYTNRN